MQVMAEALVEALAALRQAVLDPHMGGFDANYSVIRSILQRASADEKEALATAAQRKSERWQETATDPDETVPEAAMSRILAGWMEGVFGSAEWRGNVRRPARLGN
jgi:hypothetical protein